VLAIPVALYAFLLQAREGDIATRPSLWSRVVRNLLTFTIFIGIAVGVLYLKRHHANLFHLHARRPTLPGKRLHDSSSHRTPYDPKFEWTILWIAVALLAGGVAAAVVVFRRRARRTLDPFPELSVADDLAESISDAIDDLEAEPDARRAVIAAYARMENMLARHGLHRKPSETPVEYLRRILLGLTARADAVTRLTSLFEQAKFSRHEIDETMKQDAIGALRTIRDDVRPSVLPAPAPEPA
jgi:hypothetical protein